MKVKVLFKDYYPCAGVIKESDSKYVNSFDTSEDVNNFFDGLYNIYKQSLCHKILNYLVEENDMLVYNPDGSISNFFVEDLPF